MKNSIYKLKFKSVSRITVSPRSMKALYKDVDFKSEDLKDNNLDKKEKITIIYPFYSYNERKNGKSINYYLPGSSIKGAFFSQEKNIMCDDIKISENDIILDRVYKIVDYNKEESRNKKKNLKTGEPKVPKYKEFFENTGIEMINSEKKFETMIRVYNDDESIIYVKMGKINMETIRKLENFVNKIKEVLRIIELKIIEYDKPKKEIKKAGEIKKDAVKDTKGKLEKISNKINHIIKKYKKSESGKIIAFLGGFKGKVGTISNTRLENIDTGLYFDNETELPYGLIEVEISK